MKVGFTGTRNEITCEQHKVLCNWLKLRAVGITEFHHGCCVGADAEAAEAVESLVPHAMTHAHPATKKGLMSHLAYDFSDVKHEPQEYLARNRAIVDATDMLLACPEGEETQRSGTWSTIRYAKKLSRPVVIVWPDGGIEEWIRT